MFESFDPGLIASISLVVVGIGAVMLLMVLVRSLVHARTPLVSVGADRLTTAGPVEMPSPRVESDGLEAFRWTLAVRERAVGPDHPNVADACHMLGAMYLDRDDYAKAAPLLERALEIRRRTFGPAHRDVARTIDDLAAVYRAQGRDAEAERLLSGGMSERPTVVDPSPRRAAAQAAVEVRPADGATLRQQDAPDDPELTQLLGVVARLSGKDAGTSPDLRRALRDLGRLYYRRGEYAEAEPFLERALALAQRVRLPDASEVVGIENDLGWVRFSRRSI